MSLLVLQSLGSLAVSLQGTPVTAFPTDKIRALLAYLALEPQPHARAELLGLFWPEIDQRAAQNNLRVTLHRLRETLDAAQPGVGDALLLSTRQTVQGNASLITVDVLTFERLLADCAAHAHADLQQCAACLARLGEAAALYGGELLSGFALADAPAFEEWLLLRRESLHQQAVAALHLLVQAYEQSGDDAQAHHYASRQLALDPSREEAHRHLMRLLARRGLRAEALAQYASCRRILREQLGVEPDVETVALYEQIRAGKNDKVTSDKVTSDKVTSDRVTSDKVTNNHPITLSPSHLVTPSPSPPAASDAPDAGKVYGRENEQAQLERWLVVERCLVVALLGIGGVGKTTLAAATVNAVASRFDRVLWRSLLNAPPLAELLRDVLQRLADERLPDFPTGLDAQLALLLAELRRRRILLVLDNLESILDPDQPGHMRPGYAGYAQLLQMVALCSHQSSLLLTSRERPQGMARWEEDSPLVRTLPLAGLNASAGQAMLAARGLTGPTADATSLVERYSGNPLALKLVAQTVQELFGGDIGAFLAVDAPIFDDIRLVLDQQFTRLSSLEQELLLWLAVERAPVTAAMLRANLAQPPLMPRFLEALRALQRRSLLEAVGQGFTLQNVVIEYLTEQLVERVCEEIATSAEYEMRPAEENSAGRISYSALNRHALLKAQAPEYIRQSQVRLLLRPVAERLLTKVGQPALATQIAQLLTTLRRSAPLLPGYVGGNLLNLLLTLEIDVSAYDFSNLCVWQAYLRGAYLPHVQFTNADLTGAAFTQRLGAFQGLQFGDDGELLVIAFRAGLLGLWRARTGELMRRVTFNPQTFHSPLLHNNGRLMAQLTVNQTIDLVDVTSNRLLHTLVGDPSPIWRISFSPNGHYVASGHGGGQICLWEIASGRLCAQWQAHATPVAALAFAPDSVRLASSAVDGTVALWHAPTATLSHTLTGHTAEVPTLGFTPDGTQLITGSHDLTVRLWAAASGAALGMLRGHTQLVRRIAIAPNGRWVVTGGVDPFLYLWELPSGKIHQMLADHAASVEQIAFSPDSQALAAYDANETISVWAVASGQRLDSYRLYHAAIDTVAFSPDGCWLASGGTDSTIYLWDVSQPAAAQVKARLVGHRQRVATLAFSPDGASIASGDYGGDLRLWRTPTESSPTGASRTLLGCQGEVRKVAFSPDGQSLASASDDGLRLWSVATGRQTQLLPEPAQGVRSCAFSPDGRWLASSYVDHTICLWEVGTPTGIVLRHTLRQHTNLVPVLLFSPDSHTLFSSGFDNTLCRWEVSSGALQASWSTQSTVYYALAIRPDGQTLAAGGGDRTIRLLDSASGALRSAWPGHTNIVETLSFCADGRFLASAGRDETIRLWEVSSGACLQILRPAGPYVGMNITGVTGISDAQKATLKALGAVEDRADQEPALSNAEGLALSNAEGTRRQGDKEVGKQGDGEPTAALSAEMQAPLALAEAVDLAEQPIPTTKRPHNLPTQLTPFVGRNEELAAILQQLATPSVRLLTLLGAGGMGKTRLALEATRKSAELGVRSTESTAQTPHSALPTPHFPDGLFFVPLASIRQTSELAIAVAAAVGLNLTGGDPQQMVIRFLQAKRLLLILDNFEHLLVSSATGQPSNESSAVQFVAELLQSAPAVKVLATSREKLNLQSEQIYAIHGMELAGTTTMASAEAANAVQFFVQSARRVQPEFALTSKNLAALLRICQLVEGMPLGIEMAAAWVEMLTLEEIAAEIAGSLDFLAVDWPELPARQRSMRGVFEWSWNLLNDSERQVLRQLAIFRGGFIRNAAEQVAGASLRVLTSLLQKSLLRRSTSSGEAHTVRYELHELLRQFAAEQLATQPAEQQAVAQRHSAFYLALVATRERRLARNELKGAASEIQSELDNVRKAWLAAVQQDAWRELSAAAYALRLFYTFTSLEPEGEQLFQLAIERLRLSSAPASQRLRSKLLGFQAILQIAQLKHQEAMAAAQEAMAINAALTPDQRDGEGETFAPLALGMVLSLNSPGAEARTLLEQALTLAHQHQAALPPGQTPLESLYDADWVARISLRDLDRYADNYPGAVAHIQQAVQLCRALGKTRGEMVCLSHLADPLIKVHDYAAAQQACTQGLALARALHNRWGEAFSLHHLGNATRLLGYYGEAQRLLESAYTIMQADSDLAQEAMVAALLGHLHNLMGAGDPARTWFDRFLALLQQFHEPWDEVEMEGVLPLALFYLQQGDHGQALRYATRGLQIAQRYGWRQNRAQALLLCGQA